MASPEEQKRIENNESQKPSPEKVEEKEISPEEFLTIANNEEQKFKQETSIELIKLNSIDLDQPTFEKIKEEDGVENDLNNINKEAEQLIAEEKLEVSRGQEKSLESGELPSYTKMYEISGQEEITEHSFLRYQKSKETDVKIKSELEHSATAIEEKINSASENQKSTIILEGLRSNNHVVQEACFKIFVNNRNIISKDEKISFIKQGLDSENFEIQRVSINMISDIPENEIAEFQEKVPTLIKQGLESNDVGIQNDSAYMIRSAPVSEKVALIKQGLDSSNPKVQETCAELISTISSNEEKAELQKMLSEKIRSDFSKNNGEKVSGEMIKSLSESEKVKLLEEGLDSNSYRVKKSCAELINQLPYIEQNKLKEKISLSVRQGLTSEDITTQKSSAEMIRYAPDSEQEELQKGVSALIKKGFSSNDPELQKASAEMILYASETDVIEFVKAGLNTDNIEVQKICASMLVFDFPEEEKRALLKTAEEKVGNYLVQPPLYKNKNISEDSFSRMKTGDTRSSITLLGGKLKDKIIQRHMAPEAFVAWQKLYENHNSWEQEGFDYVPIEPIVSFNLNKEGLVDVSSGVLDLSLEAWKNMSSDFTEELEADSQKILGTLKKDGVSFADPHERNFCLRFFRNEDGKVDFSKKPRIYLIDFDNAAIEK